MVTVMNLPSLDLNLLLVLHTMLEESSVSRSARRLNVTSSAVSNALARLREALGDPLFVRSGRGVVPTPRALEMKDALATALGALDRVVAPDDLDPSVTERKFTLALSDYEQVTRLPRLVADMVTVMPRARLEVVSIDTLLARGGLESGGASATMTPQPGPDLHSKHLYDERGALVVRAGHPLLRKRRRRQEYFASLRHVDIHVALGTRGRGHAMAEEEFEEHRVRRNVAVTVPSFTAAAMVAAATDLVAGLPVRMVEMLDPSPRLVVLEEFSPPSLALPMYLTWHERTEHDPLERVFREIIVRCFSDE